MKQSFSHRLKSWRRKIGLTQVQAAARLGVNPRTYPSWERGFNQPSVYAMPELEKKLKGKR